jgi:mannitol 2-dehydrogenase
MTIKLTQANLSQLGPGIRVPLYDRRQVGESIVHVGVGGFHRAHQAVYADDLLNQHGPSEWGLCGVGLLPHDARMRTFCNRRTTCTPWWSEVRRAMRPV